MRNVFGDDFRQNEDATNWIRIGEVSSVDPVKCTARVVFDDEDEFVSSDLPIIHRNTQDVKDYWLPAVGEDVLCLFLPCGEEDGFIIGSFYADEIEPPITSETKRYTKYPDGTEIEYDWKSHELKVNGAEKITFDVPELVFNGNLKVDGDIIATGGVSADGEVTAMAKTTNIKLSTHQHPTAVLGPPSPPTPGT